MKKFVAVIAICFGILLTGCGNSSHHFSSSYSRNEHYHWKECLDEACNVVLDKNEHTFVEKSRVEPTSTTDGCVTKSCSKCGYEITEVLPHTCNHSTGNYIVDDTYHWKVCSICGATLDKSWHIEGDWIIDKEATKTSDGTRHKECSTCHKILRTETFPYEGDLKFVDFYAVNDFHGEDTKLSKMMGFLKSKNNQDNTIILDSGDAFQGSMMSNTNHGKLVINCMNQVGYASFTIGNHDFDWGIDKLEDMIETANMPVLGANVYKYDFASKTIGDFDDEHFEKYTIKTLENGLKVGIIGVIGDEQITSICTDLVKDVIFKDPVPIVKSLANELRNDKKCDVVVLSCHCDAEGLLGSDYKNNTQDLEKYVDAVFMGHTHQNESYTLKGLPFIQTNGYGKLVSNIKLRVDYNAADKVTVEGTPKNISYSNSWPTDSVCEQLIEEERNKISSEGNEVLVPYMPQLSTDNAAKLSAHSMAYMAAKQNYTIDVAITNARTSIFSGTLTYEKLYKSFPFDNRVYIAEVTGKDLIKEASYNQIYRVNPNAFRNDNTKYTVAVIDYLLVHTNMDRTYDYFRNGFTIKGVLSKDGYENYNYRFVLRDFLRVNGDSLNTDLYTKTNNRTNVNNLTSSVSF